VSAQEDRRQREGTVEDPGAAPEGFVSLYRRYRPWRFSELRGQSHVVRALSSAVRDGKVAHAYLFSGPRGTGKTSTARILAKALNCERPEGGEPCGRCASCRDIARGASLDVHELDAASNNGVEAMRDLVARAALGSPGRWKVYIVDEVHMLSNAAANALLKTLEEPPGHVVFVLATTDPQKVPPTIRSRTQHFEFRLLGSETLQDLLSDVRVAAGLELDDGALAAAVRRGRGSARDALTALDQLVAAGGEEEERPTVARVTDVLDDPDPAALLVAVAELHEAGWSSQQVATELVDELRQAFLLGLSPDVAEVAGADRERLTAVGRDLGLAKLVRGMELLGRAGVEMREAPDPRVVLEIALVRLTRPELDDTAEALLERVTRLERAHREGPGSGSSSPAPAEAAQQRPRPKAQQPQPPRAPVNEAPSRPEPPARSAPPEQRVQPAHQAPPPAPASVPDRDTLVQAWGDHVLRSLPPKAKALCSAGRFVAVTDGTAEFALPKAAHRDRCQEVGPVVEEALQRYFGSAVPVRFTVEPGPSATDRDRPAPPASSRAPAPERVVESEADAGGGAAAEAEEEVSFDPDDTASADEIASVAEARVLDAFPGAQEVRE
jgi:DNA polymerase III subunit gamma/tau